MLEKHVTVLNIWCTDVLKNINAQVSHYYLLLSLRKSSFQEVNKIIRVTDKRLLSDLYFR